MQASTATCLAGGIGRSPFSNVAAYCSALRRSSSVTDTGCLLAAREQGFALSAYNASVGGSFPAAFLTERLHACLMIRHRGGAAVGEGLWAGAPGWSRARGRG